MKLNYSLTGNGPTIMLLHGLFGSLDNLATLAKNLSHDYQILQIDLRNHGHSPHFPDMNYECLAQDIKELIEDLSLSRVSVIGHSMGGKVAMALTAMLQEKINKLIVIDIAPVNYPPTLHNNVFLAINAVRDAGITERSQAIKLMAQFITEPAIIQFLLKSFRQGQWLFNVDAIQQQYTNIAGWQELPPVNIPTLFLKGEHSPYIKAEFWPDIVKQFPLAKMHIIAGANHWLHAEKPDATLRAICRFLQQTENMK